MKTHIKKLLPNGQFARSVTVLAGGTAAGQGIIVLTSPLLTRLYDPADFGILAVYTALLGVLSVIASLRYQLAIPLPENDEEATHLVALSLIIVAAMSLLATIPVIFFAQPIADLLNTPTLSSYLWLLPIGMLLSGIYQIFNYWAIRVKAFTPIARTKLTQAIATVIMQLGGYTLGPVALILGQISGQAIGSSSLGSLTTQNRWSVFKAIQWRDIHAAAGRYVRFPIYSTWGGLFNTASSQLPPILFAILFSPAIAGVYMIANRVLAMPMTLIGNAIANVFLSNAAEAHKNGNLSLLVESTYEKLANISMPPALVLLLSGPDLFDLIFGANWRQAGEFAQLMAPWIYLSFVCSPLTAVFDVLEKQAHELVFQTALLATRACALIVGAYLEDLTLALSLFTGGSSLCYVIVLVWIISASENKYKVLCLTTAKAFAVGTLIISPLFIFYVMFQNTKAGWITAIVMTTILTIFHYFFMLKRAQSIK